MDLSRRRVLQLFGAGSVAATAAACSRAKGNGNSKGGGNGGGGGGGSKQFTAGYPYDAPPKGNFNPFDGIVESIPVSIGYLYDYILLPGAMYYWKEQKYYYLLADDTST